MTSCNEANQYKIWTSWFKKGQTDGSMMEILMSIGIFFYHCSTCITGIITDNYAQIQPFIENMIDRMYSTNFQRLQ